MQSALLSLLLLSPSELASDAMRAAVIARQHQRDRLFSPGPTSIRMPRFVYVRDTGLELPFPPWQTEASYAEAFEIARRGFHETQPLDGARALIVFTSFDEGGHNLFYVPLANDVLGLGDTLASQIFDESEDSSLDGYVWMGPLDRLEEAGDSYFREAFLHEIAHRWGSYAAIRHPDLSRDGLRGRQSTHWSFLLDREKSPMDGNDWVEDGPDRVTAFDDPPELAFSPLDLYLMGVLPPEAVPPFEVIVGWSRSSPAWLMIAPDTTPAHRTGAPVRLHDAQTVLVTIDDVIAASGPRVPQAIDQRVTWKIGVVFLSNGFSTPTLAEFERLDQRLAALAQDFERATGGRMIVDLAIEGAGINPPGASCLDVDECDRTQSDACIAPAAGEAPICTRTCATEEVCGPSQCCLEGHCIPARYCGLVMQPTDGGGTDPTTPNNPGGGLVLDEKRGCSCSSSTSTASSAWMILLALALSRVIRARCTRRS